MQLTNPHPYTVILPTLGISAEEGETIDATGDDAQSLKAQGWTRADPPKSTKADKATTDEPKGSKES